MEREDRIEPLLPIHPAVLKKSADLVAGKRVLEHSLIRIVKRASKEWIA